jgi:HlyD family secretion protein
MTGSTEADDPLAQPPQGKASAYRASGPGSDGSRSPEIIVALICIAIFGLSFWYLLQPQPLLIQGEAGATRIDIAARVDGRVADRPVSRGETSRPARSW